MVVDDGSRLPLDPRDRVGERLLAPQRLLSRKAGDITVLVDVQTGEVFELNATAGRLFELLRGGATVGDAAAEVASQFQVEVETVLADMAIFLQTLRTHGLLGNGG